jgi:hypothetical protein
MGSLTEAVDIVKNTGNRDSGLEGGAILKSHLEILEVALVLGDLAIDVRKKTVLEDSFP